MEEHVRRASAVCSCRAPRPGRPSRGSADVDVVYGLAEALLAVLEMIAAARLRDYYKEAWRQSNEKQWQQSLDVVRARMERIVQENRAQIQRWQEDGREVTVLVSLELHWQDSGFGLDGLQRVLVIDVQLAAEGLPEPPLKAASRSGVSSGTG